MDNEDTSGLSRFERRKIERENKKNSSAASKKFKKSGLLILALIIIFAGGYFLLGGSKDTSDTVILGEAIPEIGRDHVDDIFGITYNSNPPTSGSHFPVWAKMGAYDRLISDGYLIHSLEHGYVIISYNCDLLSTSEFTLIGQALAHDEPVEESTDSGELLMHMKIKQSPNMSWFTPENPPEEEVALPESFNTESCKSLVTSLEKMLDVRQRVIIVPRVNMEKLVAVASWGRILKLDSFDENAIREFVTTYHNRGPEKTAE